MGDPPGVSSREMAAAAGELLDRLDDLYDQRPNAFADLVLAIESHGPLVRQSDLGRLAAASRSQLLDLDQSHLEPGEVSRRALAITDDLRLLCASVWANDSGHEAVEHRRVDELRRLLDAGWDVATQQSTG